MVVGWILSSVLLVGLVLIVFVMDWDVVPSILEIILCQSRWVLHNGILYFCLRHFHVFQPLVGLRSVALWDGPVDGWRRESIVELWRLRKIVDDLRVAILVFDSQCVLITHRPWNGAIF